MTRGGTAWLTLVTLGLVLGCGSASHADVIKTGSVADDFLGGLIIGYAADGTLSIDAGSTLRSAGYLGYNPGCTGTVTVTGLGSKWTVSSALATYDLTVGVSGNGYLNIQAGGQVSNNGGAIGYNSGSFGMVTVTGAGSTWTSGVELYVGMAGSAHLTVADGGTVTTGTLYASLGDLSGNGTITAQGAVLDAQLFFDSTHGVNQTIAFGTGGELNLNQAAAGMLGAGYRATGTLRIADGLQVASSGGQIGYRTGSAGTATVTGTGSKWTNTGDLYVGRYGSGSLTIDAGAQVSDKNGYVGYGSGPASMVSVTGVDSTWNNSGDLRVGYSGSGKLSVADGGSVTSGTLYAALTDLAGNGSITTRGGVLDSNLYFDIPHGVTPTLSFGTGGTLNVNPDGTGALGAGYNATGTMQIANGVAIASKGGYLGYNSGSNGTATVTGNGSKWASSDRLCIGNYGSGTLNIQAGGQVSDTTANLGSNSGSTGTVTVTGNGSTWTNSGFLYVGAFGTGILTIQDGGQVSNTTGYVGYSASSPSTATVSGSGSKWANSATLYVGESCSGTLNIQAGGQVSNTVGYLGYYAGSTGTAVVTGAGSTWMNSDDLYVGRAGSGKLTVADGGLVGAKTLYAGSSDLLGNGTIMARGAVTDADLVFDSTHGLTNNAVAFGTGGVLEVTIDGTGALGAGYEGTGTLKIAQGVQVSSTEAYLGYKSGSSGTATVTGSNSQWNNIASYPGNDFYIGYSGNGTLNVQAGGKMVGGGWVYLGYGSGSTGTATVTGTGSTWTGGGGTLYMGYSGSGSLNVQAGGSVNSGPGAIAQYAGSTGEVTVTGAGSKWTMTSGYPPAGSYLTVGRYGAGTLNIEAGGQVSDSDAGLGSNSGSSGTVSVTGPGSTWTNSGSLTIGYGGSGKLTVADGGSVTAGTLYTALGDLAGNGTITAKGAVLDANLVFDSAHGLTRTWTFGTGGTLSVTFDGTGGLGVGYKGAGALRIADGLTISSIVGYLGMTAGSTGSATVTGAGSKWVDSGDLYVGSGGSGSLTIEAGGQVSSAVGHVGESSSFTSVAIVTGPGSIWANAGSLNVGYLSNNSKLIAADGGKVTAKSLWLSTQCMVRLGVSGNDMLVLGNTSTAGSLWNNGAINLYADPFLAVGTYRPITEFNNRTMTWGGAGSYNAFGGTWDSAAKTFTVAMGPTALSAGDTKTAVGSGERLLFTDTSTGKKVGASFGTVAGGTSFSASLMGQSELDALAAMPGFEGPVFAAWDFDTNFTGGEILLSFDIGLGAPDLWVWHLDDGVWARCVPGLLAYDSQGIVSFTANDFSGYAVTAVPEPATLGLLTVGGLGMLTRSMRRRRDPSLRSG